jgi:hypothetical protein
MRVSVVAVVVVRPGRWRGGGRDHYDRYNRYNRRLAWALACGSACGPVRSPALACGPEGLRAGPVRPAVRPAGRAGLRAGGRRAFAGDRKIIFRLTLPACGVVLSVQGNNANAKGSNEQKTL